MDVRRARRIDARRHRRRENEDDNYGPACDLDITTESSLIQRRKNRSCAEYTDASISKYDLSRMDVGDENVTMEAFRAVLPVAYKGLRDRESDRDFESHLGAPRSHCNRAIDLRRKRSGATNKLLFRGRGCGCGGDNGGCGNRCAGVCDACDDDHETTVHDAVCSCGVRAGDRPSCGEATASNVPVRERFQVEIARARGGCRDECAGYGLCRCGCRSDALSQANRIEDGDRRRACLGGSNEDEAPMSENWECAWRDPENPMSHMTRYANQIRMAQGMRDVDYAYCDAPEEAMDYDMGAKSGSRQLENSIAARDSTLRGRRIRMGVLASVANGDGNGDWNENGDEDRDERENEDADGCGDGTERSACRFFAPDVWAHAPKRTPSNSAFDAMDAPETNLGVGSMASFGLPGAPMRDVGSISCNAAEVSDARRMCEGVGSYRRCGETNLSSSSSSFSRILDDRTGTIENEERMLPRPACLPDGEFGWCYETPTNVCRRDETDAECLVSTDTVCAADDDDRDDVGVQAWRSKAVTPPEFRPWDLACDCDLVGT